MAAGSIKTLEELNVERIVNEQCELRLKCIEILIEKCGITIELVSTYAHIDSSTIYRYKEHRSHMGLDKFFCLLISLTKYMHDNGIPVDEELQAIFDQTNFSNITF